MVKKVKLSRRKKKETGRGGAQKQKDNFRKEQGEDIKVNTNIRWNAKYMIQNQV